jgi:cyclic lactone autoinducer peptide
MKETVLKTIASVAEFVSNFGITTVCSGSWYQPETPEELK